MIAQNAAVSTYHTYHANRWRFMIRMVLLAALLLATASTVHLGGGRFGHTTTSAHDSSPPIVIFDTDAGFDDLIMLAYLSQEHKLGRIDLRAVTINNSGPVLPGRAIYHVRCLMDRFGLSSIPIADSTPSTPHQVSPEVREATEMIITGALGDCAHSEASSTIRAEQLIVNTIRNARKRVELITGNPLSNVANALRLSGPSLASRIDRVTIMGGAVNVSGNLCCDPAFDGSQEYNMWVDPPSAQFVFSRMRSRSLVLIPLDATNYVPITPAFLDRLQADHHTPEADFVTTLMSDPILQANLAVLYWWDILAGVAAVHDDVVTYETGKLIVVQDGPQSGRTMLSNRGTRMRFGVFADQALFEDIFIDSLNGRATP